MTEDLRKDLAPPGSRVEVGAGAGSRAQAEPAQRGQEGLPPVRSPVPPVPPVPPVLALTAAVVAFSWAGPLVRLVDTAPALAVALWRLLFAVAVILAITGLRRGGWGPLRSLSGRAWGLGMGAGALLALHFWSWIQSVQYTSVASSVILVSTQPMLVALMSAILLRERPGRGEWVGLSLGAVGAAWIGLGHAGGGGQALLGDALALLAALLAAGYTLVGRALRPSVDLWSYVLVVYGSAAALLLAVVLVHPAVPLTGYPRGDWLLFVALAAGPMLLGHTAVNYALRYTRAYVANLAVLGEPVGATLIAWLLPAIAEPPSLHTLIGGGIILFGIAVTLAGTRRGAGG
jgi:drug/metabolite transporter (DMT)-like permease